MSIYIDYPHQEAPSRYINDLGSDAELTAYGLLRTPGEHMQPNDWNKSSGGESFVSKDDLAKDPVELAHIRSMHMAKSVVDSLCEIADPNTPKSDEEKFYFSLDNEVHRQAYKLVRSEFGLPVDGEPERGRVFDFDSAVVVSEPVNYGQRELHDSPYADLEGKVFGVNLRVTHKRHKH